MSPSLINIFAEVMIRTSLKNCEEGAKVGGQLVNAVRFADDQDMVQIQRRGYRKKWTV